MTSTQYLLGWIIYLAGATGCVVSLWLITRQLPVRLKRVLCFGLATLLFVPWWTNPGMDYFAPAFLTAIYDGLGQGIEAMERAGFVIAVALAVSTLIAFCLPVKSTVSPKKAATGSPAKKTPSQRPVRKEPTC